MVSKKTFLPANKSDMEQKNDNFSEGDKMQRTITYCSKTHWEFAGEKLNELRKSNKFCDFILISEEGNEINVHKVILMSSEYFTTVIESNMTESRSPSMSVPIRRKCLESLISYIYTGKITIEPDDLKDVAAYAVILQLENLVEFCEKTLAESITCSNCFELWKFAKLSLLNNLKEKCISYILYNAAVLFNDPKSLNLSIEEITVLLESEKLNCFEEKVYNFVIKWIKANVTTQHDIEQAFDKLTKLVRFPIMNEEFIASIVSSNELFENHLTFWKRIGDYIKYKWAASNNKLNIKSVRNITPRIASRSQSLVCLYDDAMINISLNFASSQVMPQTLNRKYFGYTMFDTNFLFISGGELNKTCTFFSPIANKWHNLQSMMEDRWYHSNIYFNEKIYACGGYENKLTYSESVEVFDINRDEWILGQSLNEKRSDFGLAQLNGSLYAFGGGTSCVERLDPRTESWQKISDASPLDQRTRLISSNNTIYCFDTTNRWEFDPRVNKFGEAVNLPVKFVKNSFDVCNMCDTTYIVGYTSNNEVQCHNLSFKNNSSECIFTTAKSLKELKLEIPKTDFAHILIPKKSLSSTSPQGISPVFGRIEESSPSTFSLPTPRGISPGFGRIGESSPSTFQFSTLSPADFRSTTVSMFESSAGMRKNCFGNTVGGTIKVSATNSVAKPDNSSDNINLGLVAMYLK